MIYGDLRDRGILARLDKGKKRHLIFSTIREGVNIFYLLHFSNVFNRSPSKSDPKNSTIRIEECNFSVCSTLEVQAGGTHIKKT